MNTRQLMALSGLIALTGLGSFTEPAFFAAPADEPTRVMITVADVRAADEEAQAVYGALTAMWTAEFRAAGARFVAPRFARYRGNVRSECGIVPASNAAYCGENNTIYYDPVFLTVQAKVTGQALGTDGDMAAVGIIAHEMGHAVTAQLGRQHDSSYGMESEADCLAGAFARHAERDGSLEAGDLDEAFYAMAAAGDPELRSSGNRRVDARRAAMLERRRHGTREQRQANFRRGYAGGSNTCLA
jgi:predicted metalloprotease